MECDDYRNTLSSGINQGYCYRLQLVQSTAARIITEIKRHEHKPPVITTLPWLAAGFLYWF